jgi:hypothetical protein
MTFALLLIAVVAIALLARAASKAGRGDDPRAWLEGRNVPMEPIPEPPAAELAGHASGTPEPHAVEESSGERGAAENDEDGEASWEPITTSDGWIFESDGEGVAVSRTDDLDPGQFVAARVTPRSLNFWMVEVLGKEEIEAESGTTWPYSGWSFRSEPDARAVLELLQRLVVRPPRDANGEPRVITDDDFERARRFQEAPLPDSGPAADDVEQAKG